LADALDVENELSIIKTTDKMVMAEALWECLPHFPKRETLDIRQRQSLSSLGP